MRRRLNYARARKTLDKRYGNESVVAQKYLNKLLSWDPIPSEDAKEPNKFASYLTMCLNMMDRMTDLTELNSRRDIQKTVLKVTLRYEKTISQCCTQGRTEGKIGKI